MSLTVLPVIGRSRTVGSTCWLETLGIFACWAKALSAPSPMEMTTVAISRRCFTSVSSCQPSIPAASFLGYFAAVASADRFHIGQDIGIAIGQTPLMNVTRTAIVGRDGKTHVAVKRGQKFRQILNASSEAFDHGEAIPNAVHRRCRRHQLHKALGILL